MPKGRPKTKEILEKISETLEDLTNRIEKLENKEKEIKVETTATTDTTQVKPEIPIAQIKPEEGFPVPLEYREIINSVLNKDFGLKIDPLSDSPAFTMTIVVPDKYSNMPTDQKAIMKVDLRSKTITYAEGVNGVKMWAEQVFNNFNAETKAQIVADRITNP